MSELVCIFEITTILEEKGIELNRLWVYTRRLLIT